MDDRPAREGVDDAKDGGCRGIPRFLGYLAEKELLFPSPDGNKELDQRSSLLEFIRSEAVFRAKFALDSAPLTSISFKLNGEHVLRMELQDFSSIARNMPGNPAPSVVASPVADSAEKSSSGFLSRPEGNPIAGKALCLDLRVVHLSSEESEAVVSIETEPFKILTLFKAGKTSAVIYELKGKCLDDKLMETVNAINVKGTEGVDAIQSRVRHLLSRGIEFEFVDYDCSPDEEDSWSFKTSLDFLNMALVTVIERMVWLGINGKFSGGSMKDVSRILAKLNPLNVLHVKSKTDYMLKSFLFAACGSMTADERWNCRFGINGAFLKADSNGKVLLSSSIDTVEFRDYLLEHCFLDFPDAAKVQGGYGRVYRGEDGRYRFKLNFQILFSICED